MTRTVCPAVQTLLAGVVDYAGLFPPSGLGMVDAVEHFRRHRRSDERWMLGRFVVPASRLEEFGAVALRPEHAAETPWSLSTLLPANADGELLRLERFLTRWDGAVRCRSLEIAPMDAARVEALAARLPEGVEAFFEVPREGRSELLEAVRSVGARAKLRTGGVVAEAIPSTAEVAEFLRTCHELALPFKATAGLHHPLRGERALTYEGRAPRAVTHGFLNLGLAAALVHAHDLPAGAVAEVLEAGHGELSFDEEGASWGAYRLSPDDLHRSRDRFFQSFGSCSFSEPVHDLKELGLL